MALEGTLRDFAFSDILQLIAVQRKTGVLTLSKGKELVSVSCVEGKIVGADSTPRRERDLIGNILVRKGLITPEQLEDALKEHERSYTRLGRILVAKGYISKEQLRQALEQQIQQVIFRVFEWTDGEYRFSQEAQVDYDRELMVPLDASFIIMEGARMTDEWPLIRKRIPDTSVVLIKTDPSAKLEVKQEEVEELDPFFSFAETPEDVVPVEQGNKSTQVTEQEFKVYQLVNGADSVEEIVEKSPLKEFDTMKALADLLEKRLVRVASPHEVATALGASSGVVEVAARKPFRVPWLALPVLILLGFSIALMPSNPLNPVLSSGQTFVSKHVLESSSLLRIRRLLAGVEAYKLVKGSVPSSLDELVASGFIKPEEAEDVWGRRFRLLVSGEEVMVSGSDSEGRPVPQLMVSKVLEQMGEERTGRGPGVVLID